MGWIGGLRGWRVRGGGMANSLGGSEHWINVCLSSASVAAATCVPLEKGSYMALQSQPINRPSSGCTQEGRLIKTHPMV